MKKINNINDTLFEGIVSHTRYKPFTHSFAYRFCYFWFSLNFKHKYKFFKKIDLLYFHSTTKIMEKLVKNQVTHINY